MPLGVAEATVYLLQLLCFTILHVNQLGLLWKDPFKYPCLAVSVAAFKQKNVRATRSSNALSNYRNH